MYPASGCIILLDIADRHLCCMHGVQTAEWRKSNRKTTVWHCVVLAGNTPEPLPFRIASCCDASAILLSIYASDAMLFYTSEHREATYQRTNSFHHPYEVRSFPTHLLPWQKRSLAHFGYKLFKTRLLLFLTFAL